MENKDIYYMIVSDNDGHSYIIPENKEKEFYKYIEEVENYTNDTDFGYIQIFNKPYPQQPEWVVEIGGSSTLVKFKEYKID